MTGLEVPTLVDQGEEYKVHSVPGPVRPNMRDGAFLCAGCGRASTGMKSTAWSRRSRSRGADETRVECTVPHICSVIGLRARTFGKGMLS